MNGRTFINVLDPYLCEKSTQIDCASDKLYDLYTWSFGLSRSLIEHYNIIRPLWNSGRVAHRDFTCRLSQNRT